MARSRCLKPGKHTTHGLDLVGHPHNDVDVDKPPYQPRLLYLCALRSSMVCVVKHVWVYMCGGCGCARVGMGVCV